MDASTTAAGAFCRGPTRGGSSHHHVRHGHHRRGMNLAATTFCRGTRRGGSSHHHSRRRGQRRSVDFPAAALLGLAGPPFRRRSAASPRRPQLLGRRRRMRIHSSRHTRQTYGWRRSRAVESDAEAGRHVPRKLPRERASWRRRRRRHGFRVALLGLGSVVELASRWLKLSIGDRNDLLVVFDHLRWSRFVSDDEIGRAHV